MPSLYRILAFCLFWLSFFNLSAQVSSDFSVDNESWTVFDSNAGSSTPAVYNAAGGNPTGNISFTTSSGSVNFFWIAPSKFNGNISRAYNQNLSFDMIQSTAGTDNAAYDVTIVGSGINLVYQLPAKPGTAWTSYSVLLNESQWHDGCSTCALTSKDRMKQALSGISKFQIRLKYLSGNTGPYTAKLDNVVVGTLPLGAPPTITSFTPSSALAGATVTITGTNFNATASQNAVYFKGVKTVATSATATQLTVKVPASAGFGPLTVTDLSTSLQGSSTQSFNLLFDNNKDFGGRIIPASLGRGYNAVLPMSSTASNSFGGMDKGDLDGDGWIDLVATETSTKTIYAFRNQGSGGTVSASSFAAAIALPSLSTIPGGSPYLSEVLVVDVDSDGKPDVAASTANNSTGFLAVFRNTSTAGSISFANPVFFSYNYYSPLYMATGDLDGDGRTDFAFTTGTSPGNIFLSQNLSTPGNIDFAFGVSLSAASTSGLSDIVIGDLTGDGKPEIVCPGYNAATLSIYQNNSTPGTIAMGSAFTIPALVSYTVQLAMADLDADNKLDMVWSVYGAQYVYFTKNNYSGGTFDATSFGATIQVANKLSNPLGIAVGDINGDNKPDVIMSGYNDLAVLQNVGTAGNLSSSSFSPTTLFSGSGSASSIFGISPVVADVDGDNKQEPIFVTSGGGLPAGATGVYIFHNESYPAPQISSINSASDVIGSQVSLNGDLMYTNNTDATIRLNKISSSITGSHSNLITSVTVPTGAISGKFSLTNHGLTAKGPDFNIIFGTNRVITATSFAPSVNFALTINPRDALEVADFDDDGKMDVAVIDNGFTAKIFQNTATAGQSITASSLTLSATTFNSSYNLIALDVDGDGKVDLNSGGGLLQNSSSPGAISFLSGPSGIYTYASGYNYVAQADFNKDGKIDLAMVNGSASAQVYENQSSRGVFLNNGSLSTYSQNAVNLTRPTNYGGIVAEDFDGDGYDDIITANQNTNNLTYYLNTQINGPITASSFSTLGSYGTSGSQPINLTAKDFDGDGKIDIAVTYFNSAFVSVYLNTSAVGDINFASAVDLPALNKGYNIASQDLDGDGKAEIVVIHQPNPGPGSFTIFKNNSTSGTASFGSALNIPLTRNPQSLNIADINSDQKPDILIVASSGTVGNALLVFENVMPLITISITTQPMDASACVGTTATFTTAATGTTNLAYRWQYSLDGVTYSDLADGTNYSNTGTATLSVNTSGNFGAGRYRCKISGDFAPPVITSDEGLFLTSTPAAPKTQGASSCTPSSLALNASGGTNGNYRWYSVPTGGTAIAGETNGLYTTPALTVTTIYYVSIINGVCESTRTSVTATIGGCTTPVIDAPPLATQIGGKIVIDLKPLITTANLDLTSLQIITPPSSGATSSIDANGILTIDYAGKSFAGGEIITIKACDISGECSTQDFTIDVAGDVVVFNGISPNGANPKFIIQYIEILPDTKNNTVYIFDRWENLVWHGSNYNNNSIVFSGQSDGGGELPSGVYFYKIDFASGKKTKTGFLSLRRL